MSPDDPFDALREVLTTRALSTLTAAGITKVRLPNAPWREPANEIWANFWFVLGRTKPIELGNLGAMELTVGVLQFDIMVPENKGDGDGLRATTKIAKAFRRRQLTIGSHGYIQIDDCSPSNAPANAAPKGWYRLCVDATFSFYHKDQNPPDFRS